MSEFNAGEIYNKIENAVDKALDEIADTAVNNIKKKLDVNYPPSSKPGDPPAKRTGELQESIDRTAVTDHSVTVYTDDPVALYMELGTSKLEPRPFFFLEFLGLEDKIEQIIFDNLGDL